MQSSQKSKMFEPGDLVFAKIRGYSAWPARVEESYKNSKNPKQNRYKVFFYWSYQTAICTGKDMFDFHASKAKLGKSGAFGFAEAMWEIENKPDIIFDPQQGIAIAANSTVLDAATTSTQTPQPKKRKSSESSEAHESSSKQKKLDNKIDPQYVQLVRPCFVRLECLDLSDIFIPSPPLPPQPPISPPQPPILPSSPPPLPPSPPVAEKSSNNSNSPPSKATPQDNKSKSSTASVSTKPSSQNSKSKSSSKDEVATKTPVPANKNKTSNNPVPPEKATGKSKPTCIFCDKTFEAFNQLFIHVRRVHGNYPFCKSCEKFFASEAECRNHNHSVTSDKSVRLPQDVFNCNFCEKSFETVSQVKFHMVLNHPKAANTFLTEREQQYLEILKVIRKFLLKLSEDDAHIKIHCAQCELDESSKDYFENHIELSPHPKSDKCFICGSASESYPQHIEHLKSHCDDSFVFSECDDCQCKFVNCRNYTSHFLNKHTSTSNISVHCKTGKRKSRPVNKAVERLEDTSKQDVNPSFQAAEKEKASSSKSSTDVESEADSTEYYMEIFDSSKPTTSNDNIPIIDLDEAEVESRAEDDDSSGSQETENQTETENQAETPQNQISTQAAQENVKNLIGLQKNESNGRSKLFKVYCKACNNDIADDVYFDFDTHYHDCTVHTELECPFCGLKMPDKDKNLHAFFLHLDKHISRGMRSIECKKCSVWFFNLYNQTIHTSRVHSNTVVENRKSLTARETSSPENSANGAQQPTEVQPLRSRPGIELKFEQTLKELIELSESQLQTYNKNKPLSMFCMSCSSDVPYQTYFNGHIQTCEAQSIHLCAFCGKKFTTKSKFPISYLNHVKIHLAKPFDNYTCGCNMNFMNLYNGILHTSFNKHSRPPEHPSSSSGNK